MQWGEPQSYGARGAPIILGVGNPIYGDDGAGYCLAYALNQCGCQQAVPIPTLTLGDVSFLEGADTAVIVDVAEWIDGEYRLYRLDAGLEELAEASIVEGAHEVAPIHLAAQARALGLTTGEVYLLLIKPERLGFGVGPTRRVLARALDAARKLLPNTVPDCKPDWRCVEEELDECSENPTAGLWEPNSANKL